MKPLALTPGEPAGIGPDLVIQLAQRSRTRPLVAVADPDMLMQRADILKLDLEIVDPRDWRANEAGYLAVEPVKLASPVQPGHPDSDNSHYVLDTLHVATRGCLDGRYAGLVTGPVHKGIINEAGIPFTGHTEFLAGLAGGAPVMMLACPGLRVALATTHLPLREVADQITAESLETTIRIVHASLVQQFKIPEPKILVCGLNPHAGEDGHLGTEEQQIISPLLQRLRLEGMDLVGPLPADTLFTPPKLATADAVLAMYHDQGLPVLKHKGFGEAVNITLGLPIIRTSVDHGTAFDLVGTGKANIGSLEMAIAQAAELAVTN